ncbi:MAG: chromosome condensation regulator [Harvfovirus sp.]|uniref:Chromosome condensation regulator n=1 Tax=Harvfovirus sp. TaxID=2487768 RepID=A0A3G5A853_9VIRU|nr:MAG: chromosome condensation regulator [Harvfovirus sp.]
MNMDLISLIVNLPIDVRNVIIGYRPQIIFNLGKSELDKYDWFKLVKIIFSLKYEKALCTNDDLRKVYLHNCEKKSKIICGFPFTIVRSVSGRLMFCGNGVYDWIDLKLLGVREIVSSIGHTMIKLKDGTLLSWLYFGGYRVVDNSYKFGEFYHPLRDTPGDIAQIVNGFYHTIIRLKDGTLMGYGLNTSGELGMGDTRNRTVFEIIKGLPKNIIDISCGNGFSFIMLDDGTTMSSGNNYVGQLGLGDNLGRTTFCVVKSVPKRIIKVICAMYHTIIRLTDGTLMSSGANSIGQLGLGDLKNRAVFEKIKLIKKNIVDIISYHESTIIRLTDGTLMGCGNNSRGQLGVGNNPFYNSFCEIKGVPKNIAEVVSGYYHTIVRLTDGTLMSCGTNLHGELGLGDNTCRNFFEEIKGVPKNVVKVTCGSSHTVILLSDGTLMASGYNDYGQLGVGDHSSRNIFSVMKITANIE